MSLEYDDARQLALLSDDLVFADWRRGQNRALILALANGDPPEGNFKTKFNPLTHTSLLHEARTQYANGFFQTGQFISARTDWTMGQPEKVDIWSRIVEREVNKPLIDSIPFYESLRSKFGLLCLHGIGPSAWRDSYSLIPKPLSVADLLVPMNTELGFENLPFLFIRKSLTGMELEKLVMSSKRDPGWNMPFVRSCLAWIDSQMRQGLDTTYFQYYRPEKWTEERKQMNGPGWYLSDRVPTIDVFDIYCYVEPTERNPGGWVRRMILDSWSNPGNPPSSQPVRQERKGLDKTHKGDFLFSSKGVPVADSWQNVVSVQYADLSAGFPAMHNAVRGLGWLAYALCHIEARMKCRIVDSTFEALLQYFRIRNSDMAQRTLKVELANQGFIDETIEFVKQQDRWQPPAQFIELGMGTIKADLDAHSKSFTAQPDAANARTEKTKFQYMAELQRVGSLVSAGINQAYRYQTAEDKEIFRRALLPNSKDPLARRVRENCLRQGVPEKLLNAQKAWDVQHERMTGQGNQTLELMTAQEILKLAQVMAPEKQQVAYRNYVTSMTHNPHMALEYFPEQQNQNPPAGEQARNDFATCLQGIEVPPVGPNINRMQYLAEFVKQLYTRCKAREKNGGMVKPEELQGLGLAAKTANANLQILAKNKAAQKEVQMLSKALGEVMNLLKAFQQRLQEAAKKAQAQQQQQNGDGGKTAAAIIGARTKAQIKAAEAKQKMAHKDAQLKQDMQHKDIRTRADIAAKDLTTASDIHRNLFDEGDGEQGNSE
jgi:hypothetical protein